MVEEKDNIMYFNNDNEFTDFCLSMTANHAIDQETGIMYYDYPYNDCYLDAVAQGKQFIINEQNSKVHKRKCVNRGLITKKVSNLCECNDL